MKIFRAVNGKGWLCDDSTPDAVMNPDPEDWRPATKREQLWFRLFHERFSYPEVAAMMGVTIIYVVLRLDGWGLLEGLTFLVAANALLAFTIGFVKRALEPGHTDA